jgi:hypothetical protein
MSDSPEILEKADGMGETEKNQKGKKKFTPPILREYGEVVKISHASTTQGQNDYFTS